MSKFLSIGFHAKGAAKQKENKDTNHLFDIMVWLFEPSLQNMIIQDLYMNGS